MNAAAILGEMCNLYELKDQRGELETEIVDGHQYDWFYFPFSQIEKATTVKRAGQESALSLLYKMKLIHIRKKSNRRQVCLDPELDEKVLAILKNPSTDRRRTPKGEKKKTAKGRHVPNHSFALYKAWRDAMKKLYPTMLVEDMGNLPGKDRGAFALLHQRLSRYIMAEWQTTQAPTDTQVSALLTEVVGQMSQFEKDNYLSPSMMLSKLDVIMRKFYRKNGKQTSETDRRAADKEAAGFDEFGLL